MTNGVGTYVVDARLGLEEPAALERFDFTEKHMGVPVQIVLYAADQSAANAAARAAYARISQLDKIMTDYDPESELMRLCRQAGSAKPIPVTPIPVKLIPVTPAIPAAEPTTGRRGF